jgi:hypothetical protein
MNARQANTEARKRLGAGARISVTPDCGGQMMLVGRKTTNGCGCPGHLQPCPGGVPIYSLERTYVSPELGRMRVGEARGASYEDVLARYDAMRAAERERFAAFRKAGTKPARSSRKGHP